MSLRVSLVCGCLGFHGVNLEPGPHASRSIWEVCARQIVASLSVSGLRIYVMPEKPVDGCFSFLNYVVGGLAALM